MDSTPVKHYMKQIKQRYQAGGSTEHSYRGDLQQLINELDKGIKITNEPQRQDFGAPDYVIKIQDIPIGHIEAKDIGVDLNKAEKSDQMKRYLNSLDNLILTDYLEFRFYRYGEKIKEIKIGSADGKFINYTDTYPLFIDYMRNFCDFEGEIIKSAEKLSKMMAQKARIMEGVILKAIKTDHKDNTLRDQYNAFKNILIHDLDEDTFADIYAQTITYGMFAARLHDPNLQTFSRHEAAQLIPKSNPFLRNLFQYIAGYDLDNRIKWIVEALSDVFRLTDISALIKNMGDATKQNDPMIHFYETFLTEYDPKLRKKRGVWYTPEPVVNFIVRAVDDILKSEFDLPEGLADNSKREIKVDVLGKKEKVELHKVQILDPTAGTGTFLAEIVKLIYGRYKTQQGIWNDYVENHLIPRLNGFELLMAPYAMAHLKLDILLSETGYKPSKAQRFRIFLTNALEEYHPDTGTIFASWLSQEANEANYVKRDTPVMVVLGNPPYSVSSSNKGEWIQGLITDYKTGLNEKKINIDDDYIKFIRYGQYFIEKSQEGILAYISNNSFLTGITHRQMRKHMLKCFDKIYIINLHGNTRNKEVCPDGTADENVFDIQQGVSINLFIKQKKNKNKHAQLYYYDLWGKRELKYKYLRANHLTDIDFVNVDYRKPYYFYAHRSHEGEKKYYNGFSITDILVIYNSGIKTDRDKLFIDFETNRLKDRVNTLLSKDFSDEFKTEFNVKDSGSYKITEAISGKAFNSICLKNVLYRPFDVRCIYYDPEIISRSAYKAMRQMISGNNIALLVSRSIPENQLWNRVLVTNELTDIHSASDQTYVFPLYLYEDESNILGEIGQSNRKPNLNMDVINQIANNLSLKFTSEKEDAEGTFAPIDIIDYVYAVLHSPSYREKYKEFLKIDFPRIPYPNDKKTFWQLVKLGGELRNIHLFENPFVEEFITIYPEDGSNEVENVRYESGKVWINDKQFFDNVPEVAWEFYIGGYQPSQKWLKDRKGRVLGFDEVRHYHKMIKALVETDRIMKEIDAP